MSKLHSFEEFEKGLRNEKIPKTDLNNSFIIDKISNKKRKKKISLNLVLVAVLIIVITIPSFANEGELIKKVYKNIKESIFGEVVVYLEETDNDGGFSFIEQETTEEEKKSIDHHFEVMDSDELRQLSGKIASELKEGEVAKIIVNGGYGSIIDAPKKFYYVEDIMNYGLDISFPNYIPEGYELEEATLRFCPTEDLERDDALRQELEEKNLPYLYVKMEDSMMYSLDIIYSSKEDFGRVITVRINLTTYPSRDQAIVEKDSGYKVDVLNMGGKEVIRWNYGGNHQSWDYYAFKIPNRKYKTYEISISKSNPLPFEELEKMIESYK